MGKKSITLRPIFEAPIDRNSEFKGIDPDDARHKAGARGKKNIGHYFTHLIAAMYGGYATGELFNHVCDLGNGYVRNFNPDVVRPTSYGTEFTEVKSVSARTAGFDIKKCQIENYTTSVLDLHEKDGGERRPAWNLSFARYGNRRTSQTHLLEDDELVRTLSHSVREIITLPSNLAIAILLMADPRFKNQYSSRRPQYESSWKISGHTITALNQGNDLVDLFNMDRFNGLSLDDLMIDRLKSQRYDSGDKWNIWCQFGRRRFKVRPFNVMKYFMSKEDQQRWFDFMYKNHELIAHTLDMEDGFDMIWNPQKYADAEAEFEELWGGSNTDDLTLNFMRSSSNKNGPSSFDVDESEELPNPHVEGVPF